MSTEPIRVSLALRCPPDHAFDTYARRIGEWWDPRYTADADTFTGVTIEPRVGGRVVEHHGDGRDVVWGTVTVWQPGRILAYTSSLAQAPGHPTRIELAFAPDDDDGAVVLFQHGGWDEDNAADHDKFSDWPQILERFTALADADASTAAADE